MTVYFYFLFSFFFFNDTATTEIYTLSLHDALPISHPTFARWLPTRLAALDQLLPVLPKRAYRLRDRKSTRLNSSHEWISYAVFCLKKKNRIDYPPSFLKKKRIQTYTQT